MHETLERKVGRFPALQYTFAEKFLKNHRMLEISWTSQFALFSVRLTIPWDKNGL